VRRAGACATFFSGARGLRDIEDDDGSAILTKKMFIGQLKVDAIKC
jgi:hypothetical protein